MLSKDKKQATIAKKASSFIFVALGALIRPILYLLYGFKFEMETSKNIKRPCFILANHQTGFDHFVVGMGFYFGINYVATDTIFRHGLLSKLMVLLVRPIPYSKGSSDLASVRNMMSVIRDGGCVCMFPSGNRSFYGTEGRIVPGIGKLAKKFNVPLVLIQIRGGYNTRPRWMVTSNKGKMSAAVTRVVRPEELSAMTGEEIDAIIRQELSFNEFEYNKTAQIVYRGRRKAEYLESILFYCPQCTGISGLCSEGNEFFCLDCGMRVRINGTGFFEKLRNAEAVPETILEWGDKQLEYIKAFDFSAFTGKPAFSDANVAFYKAERASKEVFLATGQIELYADKLVVCGHEFFCTEITTAIVGVRKMTIYSKDGTFAVVSPFRVNLLKYMMCAYHLQHKALGNKDDFYGY